MAELAQHVEGSAEHVEDGAEGGRQGDVDPEQFSATMKLIDREELRPVMKCFGVAKAILPRTASSASAAT